MKVEIVHVTPEIAAEWLATSPGNPRWRGKNKLVDNKKVEMFARDMANGRWHNGNNTIGFKESGELDDGHHRLMAIIKSGVAQDFPVLWGISKEGENHVDDNRKRTDVQRSGFDSQLLATPLVHAAFIYTSQYSRTVTYDEKLEWLDEHPAVFVAWRIANAKRSGGITRKAGVCHAYMCALEAGVTEETIEQFNNIVNTGFIENKGERSGIILRNYFLTKKRGGDVHARMIDSKMTQAALRDFLNGNETKTYYKYPRAWFFESNKARGDVRYRQMFMEA